MIYFVEKKPRLFNSHVFHLTNCELLPANSEALECLEAETLEQAIALARLQFDYVRPCRTCTLSVQDTYPDSQNIELHENF